MSSNKCAITPFDYIICHRKKAVVGLLLDEGYSPRSLQQKGVFKSAMEYIYTGGDKAVRKFMLLHPDRDYFISESNYDGDEKWTPFNESEDVRTKTDLELEVEKQNLENLMKNPPVNEEINREKIRERLHQIYSESQRRLKSVITRLQLGTEGMVQRQGTGISINLKNEHLAIIALVIVFFFLFRNKKKE